MMVVLSEYMLLRNVDGVVNKFFGGGYWRGMLEISTRRQTAFLKQTVKLLRLFPCFPMNNSFLYR